VTQGCGILLHEATDYNLQNQWRAELLRREDEPPLPALVPRQLTGRALSWSGRTEARQGDVPVEKRWAWNNIRREDGLTARKPLRTLTKTQTPGRVVDLFSLNTYLDDILNFSIVPLSETHQTDGSTRDLVKDGKEVAGSGEFLREKYITRILEKCNILVRVDERSNKKYQQGVCSQVQVGLGFEFNFSDPL